MRQVSGKVVEEMLGLFTPALPAWERDGRYWDALRPGVEPEGLTSPEQVAEMRAQHLVALGRALEEAELLVLTLGPDRKGGSPPSRKRGRPIRPRPGTIAGEHDPDVFVFRNYGVAEILEDFTALEEMLAELNPALRWLLTVSPVPLAATASDDHVLTATMRSKAVLRVVCDMAKDSSDRIDYFPSYEMVMSPAHHAGAFAEDLRSVRPEVVEGIMALFLAAHGVARSPGGVSEDVSDPVDDAVCEDVPAGCVPAMTRAVAVVGTSNIGAVKYAEAEIAAAPPRSVGHPLRPCPAASSPRRAWMRQASFPTGVWRTGRRASWPNA